MADFVYSSLLPYVPYVMIGSMILSFGTLAVEEAVAVVKKRRC